MNNTPPNLSAWQADGGHLAENIMYFARILRKAGLPVGPGSVLDAIKAIESVGVASRADFYWALHAVFVNRREQGEIFDQAFHFFWKDPDLLKRMMRMLLPAFKGAPPAEEKPKMSKRLFEALAQKKDQKKPEKELKNKEKPDVEIECSQSFSNQEILAFKDFEKMSVDEYEKAKKAVSRLVLSLGLKKTRRFQASPHGQRADLRKTLRDAPRSGGALILLRRKKIRKRPPPLVTLCDISGSMDRYARIMLHFMHSLTNNKAPAHNFLFGTRLTNISRLLQSQDPDMAIEKISNSVTDWGGGTRIGGCLSDYNKNWARRISGQNAIILLITDGLDRDTGSGLRDAVERLGKSCRRLIWLNPLLRYDAYAPLAQGAQILMKYVDEFRPVHNLESLAQLADALSREPVNNFREMQYWRGLAA